MPDPDSPTMPSVLPRFHLEVDPVHGLDDAGLGVEVRLEPLDSQEEVGLCRLHGGVGHRSLE